MSSKTQRLTSGWLLARNTLWSLLGTGLPLGVAAVAIPILIDGLGTERFGLLSIIWVTIGYFSVFDLGLSRALTKLVAERLGDGGDQEIPQLVITALVLIGALGIAAAIIVASISPWLVGDVLKTSALLRADGERAFWILAFSLPFIIISGALIGLLEAHQRFRAISTVRMVTGSLTFLGPLIALYWTPNLTAAAGALAATRILATGAYTLQCRRAFPSIWRNGRFQASLLRPLINFGGWFTASNIIGPFMVYMDRFVIGAMLNLTAVTYYTTPYEVVTRLWVLPRAFMSVLFPAFTTALAVDETRVVMLFGRAYRILMLTMLPPIALIVLFAPEGLSAWVGPTFAQHSSGVLRWLAVGVLINSLARLPHALVQSAGRPDLIAKIHFAELPVYLLGLWFLLHAFGIVGAAIAWTLRITVDTLAFFWMGARLVPAVKTVSLQAVSAVAITCTGVGLLALIPNLPLKVGLAVAFVVAAAILAYREARVLGWSLHATRA